MVMEQKASTEGTAELGAKVCRVPYPLTGPGPYPVVEGVIQSDGLELIVADHCNLRCRACAYLSPVMGPRFADPDGVRQDLSVLAKHYRVTEVRLLGGEPLLHPGILDIIAAVRDARIAERVRLLTNGLGLSRMPEAFWDAIDEVSVSMYPERQLLSGQVECCRRKAERFGVRIRFKDFNYFRESHSEQGTTDEGLIARIYQTCQMAHVWRCHTVSRGFFYRCPQSAFLPSLASSGREADLDGLEIQDSPSFGQKLLAFLESDKPLNSCAYCLGSVGKLFQHEQVSRRYWRNAQQQSTEALVDWGHLTFLEENPGILVRDTSFLGAPLEIESR